MRFAKSVFLSMFLALGLQSPAQAFLMDEGSSTFNVDLTAGLPIDFAGVIVGLTGLNLGETLAFDLFPELDGDGLAITLSPLVGTSGAGTFQVNFSTSDVGFTDGLFSFRLTLDVVPLPPTNDGFVNISSLTGYESAVLGGSPILTVTPTISAVTEPATLALLGLGLAGLAAARRRKLN